MKSEDIIILKSFITYYKYYMHNTNIYDKQEFINTIYVSIENCRRHLSKDRKLIARLILEKISAEFT